MLLFTWWNVTVVTITLLAAAAAAAAAAAGHHTKATHRGQQRVPESYKPTCGPIVELHAIGDDGNVGQQDAWRVGKEKRISVLRASIGPASTAKERGVLND